MEKQSAGKARYKRIAGIILLNIFVIAFLEGVALLVVRFVLEEPESAFNGLRIEARGGNPFHPYLGWTHPANSQIETTRRRGKKLWINTDSQGYSITPREYDKPDVHIVMTGGSVVFGVGASSNEKTIPSLLEEIIYQDTGIKAEVHNLGRLGYFSFSEMLVLNRFVAEQPVDIVVSLSARNDAYTAKRSPYIEYAYFGSHVWENATKIVRSAEQGKLPANNRFVNIMREKSNLVKLLCLLLPQEANDLDMPELAGSVVKDAYESMDQRVQIAIRHYSMMSAIAESMDGEYIMFLQPTLFTKSNHTRREDRLMRQGGGSRKRMRQERAEYEQEFYSRLKRAKKTFRLVDVTDAIDSIKTGSAYEDECHFNDLGAQLVAMQIYKHLKPEILKRCKKKK